MFSTHFEDLKTSAIRRSSEPQTIESRCDYISKIDRTKAMTKKASPTTKDTCTKTRGARKLNAHFYMYASDGPSRSEVQMVNSGPPAIASNSIDQRMYLSCIHMLPVQGEIEVHKGEFPDESVLSESALLQIQEARTLISFFKTQDSVITARDLKKELDTIKERLLSQWDPTSL
jgi:hypothetical protein